MVIGRKGQRRITLWLPEGHYIFSLPPGQRARYIREKLEGSGKELVKEAVKEALRELDLPLGVKPDNESPAGLDLEQFKTDLRQAFGFD